MVFTSRQRLAALLILILLDSLTVGLAFSTAYLARFIFDLPLLKEVGSQPQLYFQLSLLFLPVWLLAIAAEGGYNRRYLFIGSEEYRRLFHATAFAALGSTLITFLLKIDLSRGWMGLSWLFALIFLLLERYLYRRWRHFQNQRHPPRHKILIVGSNKEAAEVSKIINQASYLGSEVVGALNGIGRSAKDLEVIGHVRDLKAKVAQVNPEAVVVIPSALGSKAFSVYSQLKDLNCSVYITPSLKDVVSSRVSIQPIGELPLIKVEKVTIDGLKGFLKRLFDLTVASVLTLLLLPFFLVIAVAIKLNSPGPVFFKQTRVGKNGRHFTCLKFRSMVVNAEAKLKELKKLNEAKGHIFKIKNDPRITKVGRWLRRYSLDELPQLFNVIKGEMSLVGPRPPLPSEVANYNEWEQQRLAVKPGMTGYWQIYGRAKDIFDFEEVVKMDLFYIENWSLTLDLYILWRTLWVVLAKQGSY